MSDVNGAATAERVDELAALRADVQELRKQMGMMMAIVRQASTRISHVVELQTPHGDEALAKALADRDAYRLEVQHLHAKLHPITPEDFHPAEMVVPPETAPNLFEEVLARLEIRNQ